jgi:hypothetical protein
LRVNTRSCYHTRKTTTLHLLVAGATSKQGDALNAALTYDSNISTNPPFAVHTATPNAAGRKCLEEGIDAELGLLLRKLKRRNRAISVKAEVMTTTLGHFVARSIFMCAFSTQTSNLLELTPDSHHSQLCDVGRRSSSEVGLTLGYRQVKVSGRRNLKLIWVAGARAGDGFGDSVTRQLLALTKTSVARFRPSPLRPPGAVFHPGRHDKYIHMTTGVALTSGDDHAA